MCDVIKALAHQARHRAAAVGADGQKEKKAPRRTIATDEVAIASPAEVAQKGDGVARMSEHWSLAPLAGRDANPQGPLAFPNSPSKTTVSPIFFVVVRKQQAISGIFRNIHGHDQHYTNNATN